MGDRKPSQFLRHLRGLAPDVPEDVQHLVQPATPPIYRPTSPVNRSAAWKSQRAVRTAYPRSLPCRRSPTFHQPPTALHSKKRLRTSPDRWHHSAPSGTASAPASGTPTADPETPSLALEIPALHPGTAAGTADPTPEMTQHPPSAGTTAVSEPQRRSAHYPAPTTSRETKAAGITGGTYLLHNDGPPLRY
jgi:hypothetical protein